ncbi:serine/arginine repetitive matrix protein 1-like [Littorina saxatilis]
MGDSLPSVRDTDSHGSKISRRHNNPLGTERMTESYSPTPAHQRTKQKSTESRITPSPFLAPASPRRPVPTSCLVTETCLDSGDLASPLTRTGRGRVTALQDISTVVVPETLGMDAISPEEDFEEVEEVSSPVTDLMHGGTKGKAEETARNYDNTVHERSSKPGRENVEQRMQVIRDKPGGGISHTHSSRQGSKTVDGTSPPTELSPESVRAHRSERRKENIEARSSQLKELSPDSVHAHRFQRRKKNIEARSLQQAEHSPETDASRSYTAGKGLEKNSLQPSAHSPTNSLHRHSTVPEDCINNHAGKPSHRSDKKDAEARNKHKQEMPKSGHSNAKQSVSSQGVWGTDSVVFTSTRPSSYNNPTRQSIDAGSLCLLGEESVGCSLQSPVFTAHHKDLDSPQGDQSPALFDEGSCDESLGTLVASAMDTDQSALDQRPATPSTPPVEAAHTESPPSSSLLRPAVRQPLGQLSINVTLAGASFKLPSPPHATRRERGNPSLHSPRSPPVAVGRQSLSPLHSPQSPPVIIRGRNLSPFHSPQSSPVIVRRENLNPLHSPQSPPSVVVGRQNVSPLHSPRSAPVVVRRENLNSLHSPPSPSVLVGRGTVNLPAVRNTLSPPQVTRQRTLDEMTNTVSTKTSPVSDGSELGTLKPAQPRKLFRSRKLQREPPSADDTINPELLVDVDDIGDTVGMGQAPRAPVSSQLNASLDPAARLTQYLQTVAEEQPDPSQWDECDGDVTMDPRFQQLHQTSAQDITLISQGGSELSLTCQPSTPRPATPILLDDSFDRVPERKKQEHTYAYAEVVRKQADRKKLKGFSCQECKQYYSAAGLTEAEMAVRMAECSKHRARQAPPSTPDHFWSIGFPDTQECEEHDNIK